MIHLAALLAAAFQPAEPPEPPFPLDDSIQAERQFAADAQTLGQWTAFAKWAHPDGVLVGRSVVNARDFASAQENPETALRWWPVRVIHSCDFRTAINIGGWEDPATGEAGTFHTVWVKGENGWSYLVDLGTEGRTALPDTGGVDVKKASCLNREGTDKLRRMYPANAVYERSGRGVSPDGTIMYTWGIEPDGGKSFRVHAWDGYHPRTVYDFRMPPPAEPAS